MYTLYNLDLLISNLVPRNLHTINPVTSPIFLLFNPTCQELQELNRRAHSAIFSVRRGVCPSLLGVAAVLLGVIAESETEGTEAAATITSSDTFDSAEASARSI
jgi:hypothetical protein